MHPLDFGIGICNGAAMTVAARIDGPFRSILKLQTYVSYGGENSVDLAYLVDPTADLSHDVVEMGI